ncbi:MAG: 1,4-beta-D-glucan glucohydrolase [Verrucomicrobiae bacterium]|nr:1,4-beta-D-glucan glucohydrolase [Verrucomicrobiae bacterium]
MSFPKNFLWGAAAAAYQIEGAARADGRGESVWDMFCRKPGAVWNGQSGAVACDHYRRFKRDVAMMKSLGLQAYRLSVAWPRVIPNGTGKTNAKGLAFYDKLIDELLAADIQPFVTLFHWDYPLPLYNRGGWLNRDSAEWFADYTKIVVAKLSDRVKHWMTLNEPFAFVGVGHQSGQHAPGDKHAWAETLRVVHNVLRSHGRAVQVIRSHGKLKPQIGWAPCGRTCIPATPNDIQSARAAMFTITERTLWQHTWWSDPVFFGRYPAEGLKVFGADAPKIEPGDMQTIQQPLDFFGVNIYWGDIIRGGKQIPPAVGHALTTYGWTVTPEALYWGPRFLQERYKVPVIITENGMGNTDWISLDGQVHDPQRIDFLHRHLRELRRACADGVDVRGYFQWSIMDNFEWNEGYKQRFGLVYVDYPTQRRIPKDSAYWYKRVIETNGANL